MALEAHGVDYPSSSFGSARRWKYHVFLSFRGEDTRRSFTDHLFCALQRTGIKAFRDDEELERGEVIKPSLLQAIEESLSAIVVISPNYASSTWCLEELSKILHFKKESSLHVFPIFYGVDPSDVRHQRGSFAEAFKKHEDKLPQDKTKVQDWRDALEEVANLSGWHSDYRHETKLIEAVIEKVWSKIYDELTFDSERLVGIESKLADLNSLIENGLDDVRFIGIWGIGGLGKTTLARAFYERMYKDFEVHCFLLNVREVDEKEGLIALQKKVLSSLDKRSMDVDDYHEGRKSIKSMLSNRKILLVLDDVSDLSQLENLARNQEWFGKGSLIIITTRDKHLLLSHGVSTWYDIKFLSDDESLELFHQNAFKGSKLSVDFLELSRTVIHYASGLPLALKVLGSFLCGRNILEWRDAIARFKKVRPNNGILKILKVSFDGLEEDEKTIFLDIACFFKGMKTDYVMQILQKLDLHPIIGIKVLVDKSLVIISSDTLWVHDMLEEMAKNIVVQQSSHDAGERSRIWSLEDANHVLESNMGTEAIRGIVLRLYKPYVSNWDPKAFIKMSNLKLLIIKSGWQWHADCFCYLNLPCGLKFFPSTLKVLEWKGCCLDTLPSPVRKQPQVLGKLKHLDLSHSRYLIKTPNFDEVPDLEILILEGCVNVVEVHSSLGCHKNLATVNLKGCRSIKTLPRKFEMKRLETLTLSGCSKIKRLPEFGESMERLSQLDVEETGITKLPQSLVNLTTLAVLNLRNCKSLVCLPNVIQYMKSIRILNFSGCSKLSSLPEVSNENEALEELDASGTAIKEVASSICQLKNLKSLSFSGCTGQAQSSSQNFSSIFSRFSRITRPSISIGLLLPPSLSNFSSLRFLHLSHCNIYDESLPNDFNALSSLRGLDLRGNNFVNLPSGFTSNLLKLQWIRFSHCPRLQSLPRLPPNIWSADAVDCPSMTPKLGPQQLLEWLEQFEYEDGFKSEWWFFVLNIPGSEVPSWFYNQNYFYDEAWCCKPNVSIIADIDDQCLSSEWCGIAICLAVEGCFTSDFVEIDRQAIVRWECRNIPGMWSITLTERWYSQCILLFIPCFYKGNLQFSFWVGNSYAYSKVEIRIRNCGWRVVCKEDVEAWQRTRGEGCSCNNDLDDYHALNDDVVDI